MRNFGYKIGIKLPATHHYHIGTATNVHKAIRRGLLKSRGIAFRGKSKPDPDDPRELYKKKHSLPNFNDMPRRKSKYHYSHDKFKSAGREPPWETQMRGDRTFSPGDQSTERPYNIRKLSQPWLANLRQTKNLRESMKNDMENEMDHEVSNSEDTGFRSYSNNKTQEIMRKKNGITSRPSNRPISSYQNKLQDNDLESEPLINRKARRAIQFGKDKSFIRSDPKRDYKYKSSFKGMDAKYNPNATLEHTERASRKMSPTNSRDFSPFSRQTGLSDMSDQNYTRTEKFKNFPLNVPYTTSASEFLYGTSVIESILNSKQPRRVIYKLYIYSGMNREDIGKDKYFQSLAEAKGIKVEKVSNHGIRLLDKMSNGRPHNGFILEVSPLPRLPVQSLGSVKRNADAIGIKNEGFDVQIDYQSREEAAINGTSNFIKIQKSLQGKWPLVLLLDHIVDPGNLGGIIRTASFFGISAIAISTRNCAAITPTVSKASAGASESTVLLSVQNSIDFVIESKKAGWHVYAAVAPPMSNSPVTFTSHRSLSLSDEKNLDKLPQAPSIIMMGSEGNGLRRALQNKADYEVYVPGNRDSAIDSLNVSVATGIICHMFSRRSQNIKFSNTLSETGTSLDLVLSNKLGDPETPGTQQKQENTDPENQDQSTLF
ncbi:rRNA methyltransferase 1, mitochondrial [Erysiphe necator]|nr:rRNA methyltransferase 1, mitochondrial [Erysiphe necator]